MPDPTPNDPAGPTTPPEQSAAVDRARKLLDVAPEQIGRYRILERIGGGGMGEVYRAEQRSPVRREVAIKLIKLGMDTKLVIARFEAERQALAMMDHPNIAKVHDADSDDTGRPYFVMEYVKGKPITEYADANHLTINERLQLFEQVCHAIQHAHHKGIIHRDLKPSNVLVSTQDGKPHAKVIDFGIAKATNQRLTDLTLYTQHDQFIGTPQYMSPEQADGSLDIDTRTDVYSLGVLLYELLTGSTPFASSELKQAAMEQIKKMIRDIDPPKPSTRLHMSTQTLPSLAASRRVEPKKLGTLMRGELDWIVMKALEKDRVRRYDTPTSLVEDVERFLNGMPVKAAPPSWSYRARKFSKKYQAPLAAGMALAALLVLGLIGTWIGLGRARAALARETEANVRELAARKEAQLEAYAANIGAAQIAMEGERWPEARQRLAACPADRRGWEWDFLNQRSYAPDYGFSEPVSSVTLTRNGRYLLCLNDRKARVIDLKTRKMTQSVQSVEAKYRMSDGRNGTYAQPPVVDEDGHVAVQNDREFIVFGPDGQVQKTLRLKTFAESEWIRNLLLSPHGTYLAVCKSNNLCTIFENSTGTALAEIESEGVIQFSRDEGKVAVKSKSTVTVYESGADKSLGKFSCAPDEVSTFAFDDDAKRIAVTSTKGKISIFDIASGKQQATWRLANESAIGMIAFSKNGDRLLTSENDAACSIWELNSQKMMAHLDVQTNWPRFSSDGTKVLDPYNGYIWNWAMGAGEDAYRYPAASFDSRCFTDDGKIQITIDNYRVRIWNTDQPSHHPIESFLPSDFKSGSLVSTTINGRECSLENWNDAVADAVRTELEKPAGPAKSSSIVTSPDGRWMATANADNSIGVRDTTSSQDIAALNGADGQVRAMVFSPDSQRLITGADDGTIRFWDTKAWREVASIRGNSAVTHLVFTADGNRLVIISADRSIRSWDRRTQAQREADRQSEFNDVRQAGPYVESLISGSLPWDKLASHTFSDSSLSPALRLAALTELKTRIASAKKESIEAFNRLKKDHISKQGMLDAIAQMNVSKLSRKAMAQTVTAWEPSPSETIQAIWEIASKSNKQPAEYREASTALESLGTSRPNEYTTQLTTAATLYRIGEYEKAIDTCTAAATNKKKTGTKSAQSDMSAVLALSLAKLGKLDEATKALDNSIKLSRRFNNENLQFEAASLLRPASTQPTVNAQLASSIGVGSGVESQYSASLRSNVGKIMEITGKVAAAQPTNVGNHMNLILAPEETGVLIFVPRRVNELFEDGYANGLVGRDIVVKGKIEVYGEGENTGTKEAWKGRIQITLTDRADLRVPNTIDLVATTQASAIVEPIRQPATRPQPVSAAPVRLRPTTAATGNEIINSTDQEKLKASAGTKVQLKGKIVDVRPTLKGDALNIVMEPNDSGPLLWISRTAKPAFDAIASGDFAKSVVGQTVIVSGTLGTYGGGAKALKGRLQIELTNPSQLRVVTDSVNATTAPSTQPSAP